MSATNVQSAFESGYCLARRVPITDSSVCEASTSNPGELAPHPNARMSLPGLHIARALLPDRREDIGGEVEVLRRDADNRVCDPVEGESPSDRIGALKTALPHAVADDCDRRGGRLILVGDETPSLRVADAENSKQIGRDLARVDVVRRSWRADDSAVWSPRAHRQRLCVARQSRKFG